MHKVGMQLHNFIQNISHTNHGASGGAVVGIQTLAGLFTRTHTKSGMCLCMKNVSIDVYGCMYHDVWMDVRTMMYGCLDVHMYRLLYVCMYVCTVHCMYGCTYVCTVHCMYACSHVRYVPFTVYIHVCMCNVP